MSRKILIICQVYVPDPASVGQHLNDVAVEANRRGHQVKVITSARGYDDPRRIYPRREIIQGVEVHRIWVPSLGKATLVRRLIGQILFLIQAFFVGLFTRHLSGVIVSTAPPMGSAIGVAIAFLRRVRLVYWVMDINPDQAIAIGLVSQTSPLVWLLERLDRIAVRRADVVITLDRFMANTVMRKGCSSSKLRILPPWPHDDHLEDIRHDENPFRSEHGLNGKFVVMYSGNHAVTSPLSTILDASHRLRDRSDILFLFIGGGVRKHEVDAVISRGASNVKSLPYQALNMLKYSLSAADVHLITLDERAVGVVHPCKVYGALSIGRPILFIGPSVCHVSEILASHYVGKMVREGDVDGAVNAIISLADMSVDERDKMGRTAKDIIRQNFSKEVLCGAFMDIVEHCLA